MTKRPSFADLPLASKPTPSTPAAGAVPEPIVEAAKGKKDERVTLIIRVSADDRRILKTLAAQGDTTIQDMMDAAIQDIIRRSR